jgi:uncharacterized membrane protein (UPF0127 family)
MILANLTKQTIVADQCRFADTVPKRMVGYLNRKSIQEGEGLLIDRCFGVHTLGMRFSIDVLFLDKNYRVIRLVRALPPVRICFVPKAVYVIELPVGTIDRSSTDVGDQIQVRTTRANGLLTTTVDKPDSQKTATASADQPTVRRQ